MGAYSRKLATISMQMMGKCHREVHVQKAGRRTEMCTVMHAAPACAETWEQILFAFNRPSWKHIGKNVPKQQLGCECFSHTLSGKQQWPTVSLTNRAHSLPQSTDSTVTFHFLTGHEDEVDSHFIATSVTFLYSFPDTAQNVLPRIIAFIYYLT